MAEETHPSRDGSVRDEVQPYRIRVSFTNALRQVFKVCNWTNLVQIDFEQVS